MRDLIRRFAIPLQAFTALGICMGMFWMIFVVAGFNPAPPTALDLQARSTEDVSFASMNSTAAALAFDLVAEMMPSPIVMPVTGDSTPTLPASSPTIAVTLRVVSAVSETPTPFSLFSIFFQPTRTREPRLDPPTATATLIPTRTRTPTSTPTRTPTATRTKTPVPTPTKTLTVTPLPTNTLTNTPLPTHTPTTPPTFTPLPTSTPEPSDTPVPPATSTPLPELTETATSAPQNTPEPEETHTGLPPE